MSQIYSPIVVLLLLAAVDHKPVQGAEKLVTTQSPAPVIGSSSAAESTVTNYKYETRGRRDPFRTLDVTNTIQATAAPLVRPAGPKGQLVSEIKLMGIVKSKDGIMGVI